jgi:hypothetical protein
MRVAIEKVNIVRANTLPPPPLAKKTDLLFTIYILEDLRLRIRPEIEQISPDIIERSVQSVYTRIRKCQKVGEGRFQHLP